MRPLLQIKRQLNSIRIIHFVKPGLRAALVFLTIAIAPCALANTAITAQTSMFSALANILAGMSTFGGQLPAPTMSFGSPSSLPSTGYGMQSIPSLENARTSPWASGFPAPASTPGTKQSTLNQWLNGRWQSISGEQLEISGKLFRLLSRQQSVAGYITSNENLLSLYVPQLNRTMLYQITIESGDLKLTGQTGETLHFRRAQPNFR